MGSLRQQVSVADLQRHMDGVEVILCSHSNAKNGTVRLVWLAGKKEYRLDKRILSEPSQEKESLAFRERVVHRSGQGGREVQLSHAEMAVKKCQT